MTEKLSTVVPRRIGKTQARQEFASLIEAVSSGSGSIEITDHGKIAAVILSEKEYRWLCSCSKKNESPMRQARGFLSLADDLDLEKLSREIAEDFERSTKQSAKGL